MANKDTAKPTRFVPKGLKPLGSMKDDKGSKPGPLSGKKTGAKIDPYQGGKSKKR